jgi:hypothetical protein
VLDGEKNVEPILIYLTQVMAPTLCECDILVM